MNHEDLLKQAKERYPSGTIVEYKNDIENTRGTVIWENMSSYKHHSPLWGEDIDGNNKLYVGVDEFQGGKRVCLYNGTFWVGINIGYTKYINELEEARKIIYDD